VFAILAMILQQSINGGYTILTESVLDKADPIRPEMFALLRDGGATLCLLTAARLSLKPGDRFWPQREHIGEFVAIGLCGVWAGQLLGAVAIKNIGGVIFSVMQLSQVALTLFFSVLLGVDTLVLCGGEGRLVLAGWIKMIGMAVTLTGAVLVLLLQPHEANKTQNVAFGTAMVVIECAAGGLYAVFQKRILGIYPPLVVTAWGYTFGLAQIVMTVLPSVGDDGFFHVPPSTIGPVIYAIVLNSTLGYFIMAWVNHRNTPFFVTIFFPVQFIASALFDFFFKSHKLHIIVVIGGAIITVGLYAVIYGQKLQNDFLEGQANPEQDSKQDLTGLPISDDGEGPQDSLLPVEDPPRYPVCPPQGGY